MKNSEHLQVVLANSVGNQIGPIRQHPFTCTGQTSFSARCWKSSQMFDAVANGLDEIGGGFGIFHRYIGRFVVEVL